MRNSTPDALDRLRRAIRLLLWIAFIPASTLHAQPGTLPPDAVDAIVDDALIPEDDPPDDPALIEELEEYLAHPIDLFTTTADILSRLPGIGRRDAEEILDFVDSVAPARMEDLEAMPWLTPEQHATLRLFTTLRRPARGAPAGLRLEARSRIATDLETERGYRDTLYTITPLRNDAGDSLGLDTLPGGHSYLGSRLGLRQRVLISYRGYEAGMTFDKAPGEPILHDDTLGHGTGRYAYVDRLSPTGPIVRRMGALLSAHAAARLGPVTIIVGDYSASFGQGLLLGASFGGLKGGQVVSAPFARGGGLAPYRSSGESFFRGGAVEIAGLGPVDARAFLSTRRLDATLETAPDDPSLRRVAAIRSDAYHRTLPELRERGSLEERLAGVNVEHRSREGSIGVTAYRALYDADPRGTTLLSIDGSYRFGRSMLTGELARDDGGTIAAVGGIATRLGSVRLAAAGRYLPATLHMPHGRTFGERPSPPGNEMGIYAALEAVLAPGVGLGCYLDCYRMPAPTPSVPLPHSGADGYLGIDWASSPGLALHAHIRRRTGEEAITIDDSLEVARRRMIEVTSTDGRLDATVSTPGERVRLRARYERRLIERRGGPPASDGGLLSIDARWAPSRQLAIGARLALFDTDDFDAAIRELEGDLPGSTVTPALSGEGRRFYLYARWQPVPGLAIAAKYAETVYSDRAAISPGDLQEIAGPMTSALTLQVDIGIGWE